MAITFRAQKGQALSYAEMDTNLGSYIYSASTSNNGQQLDLHYTSSAAASMNQATIAVPLTKGIGTAGSNMRIPYFTSSAALTTTSGFIVHSGKVGIGLDETNDVPLTYALEVSGSIKASATVIQGSDERLKENIVDIEDGIEKVMHLRGVNFDWKDSGDTNPGVIAQEIQKVIPEVVYEDKKGYLGVNYSGIVPYLIEAIKDLQEQVDELKNK